MTAQINSETLRNFQAGDQKAFNEVFNIYIRQITYFCNGITGSPEDAKDIAVQTFHKLFSIHSKFVTETNIKAFLYITARNACFDYLKMVRRRSKREEEIGRHIEWQRSMEYRQIETEMLDRIYREIKNLPPRCQEIFSLLFVQHLTPKEVAVELNITVENVYNHKKRALDLLRMALLDISPFSLSYLILSDWFSI